MSESGRPKNHAAVADAVRQALAYSTEAEAIQLIEASGIDIEDGEERPPLIHATTSGKLKVVDWLISKGAKITISCHTDYPDDYSNAAGGGI